MPELLISRDNRVRAHVARHFAAPPGKDQARLLLASLASANSDFAPVSADRPLALYGGGNLGAMARDYLQAIWMKFDFVVDRNADTLRKDPKWAGHTFYHPDAVPAELKRSHMLLVTVATAPYAPLEAELLASGFDTVVPFYDFAESFRRLHPLSNGWFAAPFSAEDLRMAELVLEGLADDISRAHYLQFVAWRRLRQEWTFAGAPVTGDDRFFIPDVLDVLTDSEIFVDGGAHYGSVTQEFDRRTAGKWKAIHAFEPDPANRAFLDAMVLDGWPGRPGQTFTVHEEALGAAGHVTAYHSGLGYASQIAATGHLDVEVVPLDRLGKASFIKLHLEGGELDALKGGQQLLTRRRPMVAATVYHNDDGIWKTPLWMIRTCEKYRFLFRLHSWCGTGAVLYAIPDERRRR